MDQSEILEALAAKIRYSKQVVENFKQNGLFTTIFKRLQKHTASWRVTLLTVQEGARNEVRLKQNFAHVGNLAVILKATLKLEVFKYTLNKLNFKT